MTVSSHSQAATEDSSAVACGPPQLGQAKDGGAADDGEVEAVGIANDADERVDGAMVVQRRQGANGFGAELGHGIVDGFKQGIDGAAITETAERIGSGGSNHAVEVSVGVANDLDERLNHAAIGFAAEGKGRFAGDFGRRAVQVSEQAGDLFGVVCNDGSFNLCLGGFCLNSGSLGGGDERSLRDDRGFGRGCGNFDFDHRRLGDRLDCRGSFAGDGCVPFGGLFLGRFPLRHGFLDSL
jgi:hypothetical protein